MCPVGKAVAAKWGVTLNKEVKGPEGCRVGIRTPCNSGQTEPQRGGTAEGWGQPDPFWPVRGRVASGKPLRALWTEIPLLHPQHMSVDPGLSWIWALDLSLLPPSAGRSATMHTVLHKGHPEGLAHPEGLGQTLRTRGTTLCPHSEPQKLLKRGTDRGAQPYSVADILDIKDPDKMHTDANICILFLLHCESVFNT